jgi:hypothetical protein
LKGARVTDALARAATIVSRTLASAALLAALVGAQPALASHPIAGSFVANRDCPAYQSFRRQTNPGEIAVRDGERYRALALNRPGGDQIRVIVPGAQPPERWVALGCGDVEADDATRAIPAAFRPFFFEGADPRHATPPPPQLGALDRAILEVCGEWGARPSRAAFRALFDAPELADEVAAIRAELGGSVRGGALPPALFADELTALWFAEDGFRHIFCGEPGRDRLGGLHFKGRFLEMQKRGWGGFAPCRAGEIDPPIHTIGVEFVDRAGGVSLACPKSYSTRLDAGALLVEATRAFAAQQARRAGEAMCLHLIERRDSRSYFAVFVLRAGAIRTFYPHASPRCDGGRPASACLCAG